MILNMTRLLYL